MLAFGIHRKAVSAKTEELAGSTAIARKPMTPRVHAVLDDAVASTYLATGMWLSGRHRRAAALAFANGALVLGLSLLTDYPGGIWRLISFKSHGVADGMQAGLAGIGPMLLGFPNDAEAAFFYGQAASEVGVIAATDWNAKA
jgi:hypothetical protein